VGHSAGAAIAVRMALDGHLPDADSLVSLNGAFVPFEGLMRVLSPVARVLAATPLAARITASRARDGRAVDRLLDSTGSRLEPEGRALYARLVRSPGHVGGALAMMAGWDLERLWSDLPRLAVPLRLAVGQNDRTVPPDNSERAAARIPSARIERLAGLGHLMHEEEPERLAGLVETLLRTGLSTQPDTVRSGHVDTREATTESDRTRGEAPQAGIHRGAMPRST
jgi:magnesium chelatase accessory protein